MGQHRPHCLDEELELRVAKALAAFQQTSEQARTKRPGSQLRPSLVSGVLSFAPQPPVLSFSQQHKPIKADKKPF